MVDLIATDEQQQIATGVASFLAAELPLSRLTSRRDAADTDYRFFPRMGGLGWFGLALSEEEGGVGYSAVEEALVFRELGRVLAPPSIMATSLAAQVAAGSGDRPLAARLISGEAVAALAIGIGTPAMSPTIDGRFQILEAGAASHVLFLGETTSAIADKQTLGVLTPGDSADNALSLDVVEASGLAPNLTGPAAAAVWRRAKLLSAAMLAGICEATRDLASEYAKVRKQFDQPIGVYQAVKHKCSDMAIRAEAVNAQVAFASICVRDERPDAAFQVAAAKLLGAQYALLSAKDAIQVHGAIGFTTELPMHLFLKRAHVLDQFLGGTRREQIALLNENAPQ
jgi:alkylation response protein AidB-like acyl-CoA dehydrogenase